MQQFLVSSNPHPTDDAELIERDDIIHAAGAYVVKHFGADAVEHLIFVQIGIELPALVRCFNVRVHPAGVMSTSTVGVW